MPIACAYSIQSPTPQPAALSIPGIRALTMRFASARGEKMWESCRSQHIPPCISEPTKPPFLVPPFRFPAYQAWCAKCKASLHKRPPVYPARWPIPIERGLKPTAFRRRGNSGGIAAPQNCQLKVLGVQECARVAPVQKPPLRRSRISSDSPFKTLLRLMFYVVHGLFFCVKMVDGRFE